MLVKTIEARALNLFAPPSGELLPLCRLWNIEVPELLCYDSKAHILILADLGELDTLTEQVKHMTPLGGKTNEGQQEYKELGTRLGGFLAHLHSSSTLEMLGHKRLGYFDNHSVKDVIYDNVVVPIRGRLDDFGISDAERLYDCIVRDHLRPDEAWEQNFILGDLWTGSVLLNWPRVCIIDWEFAGIGRGVNGDIATCLAQLHLHLLVSQVGSPAQTALRTLIQSIVGEYRCQVLRRQKDNDTKKVLRMRSNALADLSFEILSTIRSAFIVHGRKMVNNAIEKDWACECCNDIEKVKRDCKLVAKLVDRGVWYLRRAAVDLREFTEDGNLTEVAKEEGKVILGLFLDPEGDGGDLDGVDPN